MNGWNNARGEVGRKKMDNFVLRLRLPLRKQGK